MAITVKTSLLANLSPAPTDFTWIEIKTEAIKKEKEITGKPVEAPEPAIKKSVKPAQPAKRVVDEKPTPVVEKEREPEPTQATPTEVEAITPEITKPYSVKTPAAKTGVDIPAKKDTQTYFELNKLSHPPAFIFRPLPKYPFPARRAGKEGEVALDIWLEPDGSIAKIEIVKSAGWGFDEAAIKAARLSKFRPGKTEGRPVRSKVRVPYEFRLK